MAVPVFMPQQGQSVETCIITEWQKQKGDKITVGDVLFAYETDKASFEEEAKTEGTLLEIFFEEGDEVPVLTNVAVIGNEGESVAEFRPGSEPSETLQTEEPQKKEIKKEEPVKTKQTEAPVAVVDNKQDNGKLKISPRAKNKAQKLGVPSENVEGTGPYGRIIERDVLAYANEKPTMTPLAQEKAQKEQLPTDQQQGTGIGGRITGQDLTANPIYGEDYEMKKVTNIRKLIAKAMHASLQNSAQLTHHLSADVRKLLVLRKQVKAALKEGKITANITLNDMVCYAVIRALKNNMEANSHFLGDAIRAFKKVHLGLAVDTERGLMVPTVKNADDLSITGLSSQLKAVAESCRKGNIDPELLKSDSATFTVSNLGNYGVEMFTPVINLPQAAILGVNTIIKRPAELEDGTFGFVPYIGLSLTYDHRILDGAPATKFLADIKKEIENFNVTVESL